MPRKRPLKVRNSRFPLPGNKYHTTLRGRTKGNMMAEVIIFPDRKPQPTTPNGNGAREVILEWLELAPDREEICDKLLMRLWERGFKIVPLGPGECG